MINRRTLSLLAAILCVFSIYSAVSFADQKVIIPNVGHIYMPSTLELQEGDYSVRADELRKGYGIMNPDIVFQQKGLNVLSPEAISTYVRVLVTTQYGNSGDFETLFFNFNAISDEDLDYLSYRAKIDLKAELSVVEGMKLLHYYPVQFERINGMSCMHTRYIRQLKENPVVIVEQYIFQNYDRIHAVTISYRARDEEHWKLTLTDMAKSLYIEINRSTGNALKEPIRKRFLGVARFDNAKYNISSTIYIFGDGDAVYCDKQIEAFWTGYKTTCKDCMLRSKSCASNPDDYVELYNNATISRPYISISGLNEYRIINEGLLLKDLIHLCQMQASLANTLDNGIAKCIKP